MTIPEIFAALLLPAIFAACLWRARLLSLAIIPPMLFAASQAFDIVDTERASHPYRWIVPVACAGLAGLAWWLYTKILRSYAEHADLMSSLCGKAALLRAHKDGRRALVASIIVLASCLPDLLALHPFFWALFSTWALTPIQIAVEATILVVLVAPERWVKKWAK